MNTALPTPIAITRALTHRVSFEFKSDGTLSLWDADRSSRSATIKLADGEEQKAVYTMAGAKYGGGVVVQPLGWQTLCRGESSIMLGSVDFPYMGGSAYDLYPQSERANVIEVTFAKLTAADATKPVATITLSISTDGAATRQVCEIMPNTAFAAVFAAFSERMVSSQINTNDGKVMQRIVPMEAGGEIALYPKMGTVERVSLG